MSTLSSDATPSAVASGATRNRRTSSVGQFSLGDNASPSLSTMVPTDTQIRGSQHRQRALSKSDKPGEATSATGSDKKIGSIERTWILYREIAYRNTWVTPLIMMLVPLIAFALSKDRTPSNPVYPFLFPSYKIIPAEEGGMVMYGKGKKDFCFVMYYMLVFSFLREFSMQQILEPLAKACGLTKPGKIKRFMEQTYSIMYYGTMSPWGLYIMHHMPLWYFETRPMYEHYPHQSHELDFKLYYLLQAAFWAQQSVVLFLQLEKPRKDFKELVFHHIVTIALIFCSYRFHFTWIGIAVYITMDVSDLALATSKTLNYLNHPMTGPFFLFFMGVWIYSRHYLNLRILWSVATEFQAVGDFTLNWEMQQYKCWISQYITFALLFALQAVNAYWLFLILRIAYRLVFLEIQKDERSDEEDEDEEDDESKADRDLPAIEVNGGTDDETKKTI
ncbi:TLC domain-containing protein [Lipomyces tetrasporus]|uniref:TLC domain-containing protein n=1 Tax=Lipomyces tetrasporus TaxID=54092 RepID=A0AAD7QTE7_9ASCO|nr:TLC domain-containing protein [Lipomyces tetrasporus]KAJ8101025.1 TLC domain-containing protein [Lipomyces tetrasporus]